MSPLGVGEIARELSSPHERGVLARGLGRSYGDAAQNAGGRVLDMTSLSGVRELHPDSGTIRVDAGVSLDSLMRWTVPRGWFPHVTPGTRFVTIGGAIAADVHGKNHHRDGTFCEGVVGMRLHTPTGMFQLTPDDDLFWATAGGMGLTGIVTDATLRLRPIVTSYMRVDTERAVDLDDLLTKMEARDHEYGYSVAWIDCMARGGSLGRAVLTRGDHARPEELPTTDASDPLTYAPRQALTAPAWVPNGLLNEWTVRAFNEFWYRKAPELREGELQPIAAFFHPLDGISRWNRLYGDRGFLQYQFVLPFGTDRTLANIVERLASQRVASFLAVLKRFGEGNEGHLSFPRSGWTLSLDLPLGDRRLPALLQRFDERVAEVGGRVYLAKDARLRPEAFRAMYPRLNEWTAIRDRVDPDRVLRSDLARRLKLVEEPA